MTNDQRRPGGGEYGVWPEEPAPQPVMRQAPQGYQPQPAQPQSYAQAPAAQQHAAVPAYAPVAQYPAPTPASSPAPPEPSPDDANVVVLSKAYQAHGEMVQRVRIKRHTVKQLRMLGYPIRNVVGPMGTIVALEELPDVVAKWIVALSDPPLPPSTVDSMDMDDFATCSQAVLGHFF
jgi:hypothetical protein